jgi:hypothetical protein
MCMVHCTAPSAAHRLRKVRSTHCTEYDACDIRSPSGRTSEKQKVKPTTLINIQ